MEMNSENNRRKVGRFFVKLTTFCCFLCSVNLENPTCISTVFIVPPWFYFL